MTNNYNTHNHIFFRPIFYSYLLLFLIIPVFVTAGSFPENIANTTDEYECVADFTYYPDGTFDKPNGFQFINLSVGNIVYVEWNFGDGASSDQFNPAHEFPEAGTYNVCLKIYCADSLGIICCSDSVCKSVIVDYNIGGHVFANNYPIDRGKAWLYKIEDEIIPVDTVLFDTLGYYFFYQIPEGEYIVKTSPSNNSIYYNSFFPVYFGDQIVWNNAERINVYNNNWELDIHLEPVNPQSIGNGFIQGKAIHYQTGEPLADIEIILTDLSYNPIKFTFTDQDGLFSISNIEYGTYYLTAEITGFYCNSLMITLDDENNYIVDLEFLINYNTYVGIFNRTNSQNNNISMLIYPNPAQEEVIITFRVPASGLDSKKYRISIRDMNGKVIEEPELNFLYDHLKLDVTAYPNGIYSVVLQDNELIISRGKLIVIH